MLKLSIEEIIQYIKRGETFEAVAEDDSFRLKIGEYAPFVCAAIHDGHAFRDELNKKTLLSEAERHYEEDPCTASFITSLPIVIAGKDSRYEYDLNRPSETCIFDTAWGKKVWKTPLTKKQREKSLSKHQNFYRVIDALIAQLHKMFGACIVYDIHSYNYKRHDRHVPVFNIGTERLDNKKFGSVINHWKKQLSGIKLPNIENTSEINDIFFGRGYFLAHIIEKFPDVLVLATEVKKIYMDEETGEIFPFVVDAVRESFKTAILNNASQFLKKFTDPEPFKKINFLSSELDKNVLKIDRALYRLVKRFEILDYINPINIEQERKQFFKAKFTVNPQFKYKQLDVNPFELKRKLYALPIEDIKDIHIKNLYTDVIAAYTDKIDMLASIGTDKFLYNSLRYFGEPDDRDLANAEFLLNCPSLNEEKEELTVSDKEALSRLSKAVDEYGFNCKIILSDKTASKALVLNKKQTAVIQKGAKFSEKEVSALVHHEIGVHMVTTMNALLQPLKIFGLGLPVNTMTQEGLAVLSEFRSGNLTLDRLRELALRVITVKARINGAEFKEAFLTLTQKYGLNEKRAYYMTARIWRGGGTTKDCLYLRGIREVLKFLENGNSLNNLLIGKTSLKYIDTINELIDRKLILPPTYITKCFENPAQSTKELEYILKGIK